MFPHLHCITAFWTTVAAVIQQADKGFLLSNTKQSFKDTEYSKGFSLHEIYPCK